GTVCDSLRVPKRNSPQAKEEAEARKKGLWKKREPDRKTVFQDDEFVNREKESKTTTTSTITITGARNKRKKECVQRHSARAKYKNISLNFYVAKKATDCPSDRPSRTSTNTTVVCL
ncbi:AAEL006035-PA, partial [Aedes aegypti]